MTSTIDRSALLYLLGFIGLMSLAIPLSTVAVQAAGNVWLSIAFCGLIAGGWELLAIWATIGPGSIRFRLPITIVGLLAIWLLSVLAANASNASISNNYVADVLRVTAIGPLLFCTCQAPFWLGRMIMGLSIQRVDLPDLAARRVGIAELFGAMTFLAVSMALTRFVAQDEVNSIAFVIVLLIGISGFLAVLLWVPLLVAVMVRRHTRLSAGLVIGYLFLVLAFLLAPSMFAGATPTLMVIAGIASFMLGVSGGFIAPLLYLRSRGYAIVTRWQSFETPRVEQPWGDGDPLDGSTIPGSPFAAKKSSDGDDVSGERPDKLSDVH
ncbi:MAG: hypothetical protein QGG36_01815 [Pirellulaceae bacterium]|jgi:hypothetical protein|nr:hypothetical protein [Pirellulaceae bacterium]